MSKDNNTEIEVEPYYFKKAQELVDLLVDKHFMRDDVSREETRILDDYIGYLFQSQAKMVEKTTLLLRNRPTL